MFCPECGIRNSEGASFCVRCGASLIADQPESATTLSYVPGEEDGDTTPFAACADDACLVIRTGGGRAGETYVLRDERIAIGRHPDAPGPTHVADRRPARPPRVRQGHSRPR